MNTIKLFLLLLFTYNISFSQINGYKPTKEYVSKIERTLVKLDTVQAKELATNMANLFREDYEFFKIKTTKKLNTDNYGNYRYYFLPKELTIEQKEHLEVYGTLKEMLKIDFNYYMEGSNEDLEILGELKLRFRYVEGSFLDLFPIWEKYFFNGTTKENILDYKDQYLHAGDYWVNFKTTNEPKLWRIQH